MHLILTVNMPEHQITLPEVNIQSAVNPISIKGPFPEQQKEIQPGIIINGTDRHTAGKLKNCMSTFAAFEWALWF